MSKKGKRIYIRLQCTKCGSINYTTTRDAGQKIKLDLMKYCPKCGTHTKHKEVKIK